MPLFLLLVLLVYSVAMGNWAYGRFGLVGWAPVPVLLATLIALGQSGRLEWHGWGW